MESLKNIGSFIVLSLIAVITLPIWIPFWLLCRRIPNQIRRKNEYQEILSNIFSPEGAAHVTVDCHDKSHVLIGFRKTIKYNSGNCDCEDAMQIFINPQFCQIISDKIVLYDNPKEACRFCFDIHANYFRTMIFIGLKEKTGSYYKEKLAEETGLHLINEAQTIGYIDYSTIQLAGEDIYFDLGNCEIESLKTQLENLCENGRWERTENGYLYHESRNCGLESLTVEYTPGQRFLKVDHFMS